MWRIPFSLLLLLLLLALPGGADAEVSGMESDLMIWVNQARVDAGLLPLVWTPELTWAVGGQVEYLAADAAALTHEGRDGSAPVDRARAAGYASATVGEVLARGYDDPRLIVGAWLDSPPHRDALLGDDWTEAGIWTARDETGRLYAGMALGAYRQTMGDRIVEEARRYLGYPYVWGGLTPSSGFDCAGYVTWVYAMVGLSLQTTWIDAYWERYPRVAPADWQPGDLIILANTYKAGISHVAIYAGSGRMLHAANYSTGVIESGIEGWGDIVGAVRPW